MKTCHHSAGSRVRFKSVEDINDDPMAEELYGLFLKVKDSPRHICIKAETLLNEAYYMKYRLEHDKNPSEHFDEYAKEVETDLGWHYGADLIFPMSYAMLNAKKRNSKKTIAMMEMMKNRYGNSVYWNTFSQPLAISKKKQVRTIRLDTKDLLELIEKYQGTPFIQVKQAEIYVNSPGNIVGKEINCK